MNNWFSKYSLRRFRRLSRFNGLVGLSEKMVHVLSILISIIETSIATFVI